MAVVRDVRAGDLAGLVGLIGGLAAHHGDTATVRVADLQRDLFGPRPWLFGLGAEEAGRLVGHALLFPLAQAQFGSRGMDLHHLFVAEDCRGQGVGRALIDGVLDLATRLGCAYVAVGTQGENARAVAVYDAAGFVLRAPGGLRLVKRL